MASIPVFVGSVIQLAAIPETVFGPGTITGTPTWAQVAIGGPQGSVLLTPAGNGLSCGVQGSTAGAIGVQVVAVGATTIAATQNVAVANGLANAVAVAPVGPQAAVTAVNQTLVASFTNSSAVAPTLTTPTWSTDVGIVGLAVSADGLTCTVTPLGTGTAHVTVSAAGLGGTVLTASVTFNVTNGAATSIVIVP